MAKAMNIVGNTYNNWKVVSRANSKRGHTYWNIKCQTCGYDKCIEAMQFHHKNPDEKDFNISGLREYTVESIQKYYDEVDKCILTCANCHFEIHAGLIDIDNINLL